MPEDTTEPTIMCREDLGEYCNQLGLQSFAVEIGTDLGRFAHQFLSTWRGSCLFCIDPWETALQGYKGKQWDRLPDLLCAVNTLSDYMAKGRCRLIRASDSQNVADVLRYVIGPGTFDCVYIDGDHTYEAVKTDIEIWWPAIRPGGILAGHDYTPNSQAPRGVARAVDELCCNDDLRVTMLKCTSWFVRKPE